MFLIILCMSHMLRTKCLAIHAQPPLEGHLPEIYPSFFQTIFPKSLTRWQSIWNVPKSYSSTLCFTLLKSNQAKQHLDVEKMDKKEQACLFCNVVNNIQDFQAMIGCTPYSVWTHWKILAQTALSIRQVITTCEFQPGWPSAPHRI